MRMIDNEARARVRVVAISDGRCGPLGDTPTSLPRFNTLVCCRCH